jgi:hypothetical protein
MKYNVKQAVSGIQGNLDQANQNALVNRGLGNLFKGIAARTDVGIKQDQTAQIQQALANQQSYYDKMLNDPKADPLKRQMADDKIQQLKFLAGITNVGNVGEFPSLYSSFIGKDTLSGTDLDLRKLENALQIANIGADARIYGADSYRNAKQIEADSFANYVAKMEEEKAKGGFWTGLGKGIKRLSTGSNTVGQADYSDIN